MPQTTAKRLASTTTISLPEAPQDAALLDTLHHLQEALEAGKGWSLHHKVETTLSRLQLDPDRPVSELSGGLKKRVALARALVLEPDLLLLDEPTNDLDIETLELLEDLLQDYAGTLFLVSHDREFLDNVVTQTIASEGEGRWKEYAGGYSDWLRAKRSGGAGPKAARLEKSVQEQPQLKAQRAPGKAKLSYKESRELAELPGRVQALEQEQGRIAEQLSDVALYREEPERVKQLQARYAAIEDELAQALVRWEGLGAKP